MINGARIVTRYEQTRANSSAMHEELCFNRQLTLLDYGDIIHAWAILGVLTLTNISCVLRDNDENWACKVSCQSYDMKGYHRSIRWSIWKSWDIHDTMHEWSMGEDKKSFSQHNFKSSLSCDLKIAFMNFSPRLSLTAETDHVGRERTSRSFGSVRSGGSRLFAVASVASFPLPLLLAAASSNSSWGNDNPSFWFDSLIGSSAFKNVCKSMSN